MHFLISGYQRFRQKGWNENRARFEELAEQGQKPRALIVSCVDSRLDPSHIFDTAPGELFIIRNVANLVPPYAPDTDYHGTSAALEFGVKVLSVPQIVVLGHGLCGGVRALLEGAPADATDFIPAWMSIAKEARSQALRCADPAERQLCCEYESVKVSLRHLMTYPWIRQRVADGTLRLQGAWYAIGTGDLMLLQEDGRFRPPS